MCCNLEIYSIPIESPTFGVLKLFRSILAARFLLQSLKVHLKQYFSVGCAKICVNIKMRISKIKKKHCNIEITCV